jgi:hypothetical protein
VWENGAENSGIGALMCTTKVIKNDTQLSVMNSFKKSTKAWKMSFHDIKTFWRISTNFKSSQIDWVTILSVHGGYQNNWLTWLHNLAAPFFEEGLQRLVSR